MAIKKYSEQSLSMSIFDKYSTYFPGMQVDMSSNNSAVSIIQDLDKSIDVKVSNKSNINMASFSQRISNIISSQTSITKLNETILDEMKKESEKITDLSLENIYIKSLEVVKLRDELNANFIKLQDRRLMLYENLISTVLYKFYHSLAANAVTSSLDSQIIESTFNLDINSDLLTNLDGFSIVVSEKQGSSSSTGITLSQDEKALIMKYGKYFLNLYDSIKEPVNLGETYITYTGMVGKYKTLFFDNDNSNISGEIYFKNDSGDVIDIDKIDMKDVSTIPEKLNVTIVADTDIRVQIGDTNNPYIIESSNDFINNYLTCKDPSKYFVLNKDISILSKDNLPMIANLNGNGHSITFSGSSIKTGSSTIIENLTFRLMSSTALGNFKFYLGNTFKLVNIVFTNPSYTLGGDILFIGRSDDDLGTIYFPTELEDVHIYTKLGRNVKIENHEDSNKKFGIIKKEDKNYYELVISSDADTNKYLIGSQDEPEIVIDELPNTIITSGTTLFSGELTISDEIENMKYFKNDDDTVSMRFDKTYSNTCEIQKLKYNDIENIVPSLTTTKFTGKDYGVSSKNKTTSSQVRTVNAIANLAAYTYLDDKINKKVIKTDEMIVKDILSNIAVLRESLEQTRSEAASAKSASLNSITDYLQSITYIESIRAAEDSSYDTTYTTNIKSMLETLAGYISVITSGYEVDGLEDPYKNALKYIMLIESESDSLIIGLVESLKLINREIDNYQIFHDMSIGNYGSKLYKICQSVSDVLADDNYKDNANSSSFNLTVPTIRPFKTWLDTFTRYTNDGAVSIAQIYLVQELCINVLKLKVSNNTITNKTLKSLVTDTLLRSCKKKLLCTTDGKVANIQALSYENELINDYEIQVVEDAPYEDIAFQLTSLDSNLGILNSLDVTDILLNPDEDLSKITKLTNMIDLDMIKYILSDSVPTNIISRVSTIDRCLNTCNKNFKTLLFEYHFRKVIEMIINIAKNNSDSTVNGITNSLAEYINYSKTEKLIKKYIAVWNFKFYSEFSNTGTIFKFIEDKNFVSFMYNYSETMYLREFEITLNAKGIINKIFNTIKNLWNGLIDWIF